MLTSVASPIDGDLTTKRRMKLLIRECTTHADWDSFVEASPTGLLFHLTDWLNILADVQGFELKRYGLYQGAEASQLLGIMPVFIGRYGPFPIAGSPLVLEDTPYLGPVVPDHLLTDAFATFQALLNTRASFVRVTLDCMISDSIRQDLELRNFKCITKHTHRLSLDKGIESIWKGMEGRCRTAIRRAEKSGMEIVRITGMADGLGALESYYRISERVYGRQGLMPPNPFELFQRLWKMFHAKGMVSLFMARLNNEDIGGIFIGHYKGKVYYLDGAADRRFTSLNASNLLLWKGLQWSVDQGYEEFDFVGSDIPRLAEFKASFGGELVTHTAIEWAKYPAIMKIRNWYGHYGRPKLNHLRWLLLNRK